MKIPQGWTSIPKYNVYNNKGEYLEPNPNDKDKDKEEEKEIMNYRGCNFGRLYILMFLLYFGYVHIQPEQSQIKNTK